jgi:L-lysine exporter family protein LysE/ArgO
MAAALNSLPLYAANCTLDVSQQRMNNPSMPAVNPSLNICAAFLAGLSIAAPLIVAIGAQNTFVLRQGLRREHVGAVVFTCVLIDAALITAGVSGLATALGANRLALNAVAFAGAVFLVAYGAAAGRRAFKNQSMQINAAGQAMTLKSALLQTLALSLLNPHVYLDTVLLVGAVGAQQPGPLRPAFLSGAASASVLWFTGLGYGAWWLTPLFAKPRAWRFLDAFVALTMWALAIMLLLGIYQSAPKLAA